MQHQNQPLVNVNKHVWVCVVNTNSFWFNTKNEYTNTYWRLVNTENVCSNAGKEPVILWPTEDGPDCWSIWREVPLLHASTDVPDNESFHITWMIISMWGVCHQIPCKPNKSQFSYFMQHSATKIKNQALLTHKYHSSFTLQSVYDSTQLHQYKDLR